MGRVPPNPAQAWLGERLYVGVQRTKSKKRPWQATVSRPGKKRLGLGSFKKPVEAAVARAEAKASGVHLLPSPRKQAPRNSGSELCPPPVTLHRPPSFPFSCSRARLTLHSVVKKGPWTLDGRCMADVLFEPVVSDTAEEMPRRHNDLKDR